MSYSLFAYKSINNSLQKGWIDHLTIIILLLFFLSVLLFTSVIRYSFVLQKSRMYPPKRLIRKRIQTLGTLAAVSLLLGVLLLYFP